MVNSSERLAKLQEEIGTLNGGINSKNLVIEQLKEKIDCLERINDEERKKNNALDLQIVDLETNHQNRSDYNCQCLICRGAFGPNDAVKVTKCGHVYHNSCLLPWIQRSPNCPKCRKPCFQEELTDVYLDVARNGNANNLPAITSHEPSFMFENRTEYQSRLLRFKLNVFETDLSKQFNDVRKTHELVFIFQMLALWMIVFLLNAIVANPKLTIACTVSLFVAILGAGFYLHFALSDLRNKAFSEFTAFKRQVQQNV